MATSTGRLAPAHLYNKKPFLGNCSEMARLFIEAAAQSNFSKSIFIVDNLFNYRGESLHLNLFIRCGGNGVDVNPIILWEGSATFPLHMPVYVSANRKHEKSRLRVAPFHFNNLHLTLSAAYNHILLQKNLKVLVIFCVPKLLQFAVISF